jgi:hypothetical protein
MSSSVIVGGVRFLGGPRTMAAVAGLVASTLAEMLRAVTWQASTAPWSAAVTVYSVPVAPASALPLRSHW